MVKPRRPQELDFAGEDIDFPGEDLSATSADLDFAGEDVDFPGEEVTAEAPEYAPLPEDFGREKGDPKLKPRKISESVDAETYPQDLDTYAAETQTVGNKVFRRHKETGAIYDEEGKVTIDPAILTKFKKVKPTKQALENYGVEQAAEDALAPTYTGEGWKGLFSGLAKAVGMTMEGSAGLTTSNPEAVKGVLADVKRFSSMKDPEREQVMRGLSQRLNPIAAFQLQRAMNQVRQGKVKSLEESPEFQSAQEWMNPGQLEEQELYAKGREIIEKAEQDFKASPGWEESLTRQVAEGAGTSGPFYGLGILAKGLSKVPKVGGPLSQVPGKLSPSMGIAMQGGAQMEDVRETLKKKGLKPDSPEAEQLMLQAAVAGAPSGVTEQVPVEFLVERIASKVPGLRAFKDSTFKAKVGRVLGKTLMQAAVEGGQEGVQQVYQNFTAQMLKYDPKRPLTEDLLQSMAVGSLVGGGLGGVGAVIEEVTAPSLPKFQAPQGSGTVVVNGKKMAYSDGQWVGPVKDRDDRQPTEPKKGPAKAKTPTAEQPSAEKKPFTTETAMQMFKDAGISVQDIRSMTREQVQQTIRDLVDQGSLPEGFQPPRFMGAEAPAPGAAPMAPRPGKAAPEPSVAQETALAPDQPSAEPISQVKAQMADLKDPNTPREGVFLSADAWAHAGPALKGTKGAVKVENFDNKGGVLITKSKKIAAEAIKDRDSGVPLQEILGKLTGAGTGKPADGSKVVQQVDKDGNVVRESLVTADTQAETEKDFKRPDHTVRVVTPEQAVKEREEKVAAEIKTPPKSGVGTREQPVVVESEQDLAEVRGQVEPEPTDGQKEAGNYKHGHINVQGFDIAMETPKGGVRRGTSPDGEDWEVIMPADYGRFKGTKGADGDQIDAFIGPDPKSKQVFILHQNDLGTGKFDEHKVIMGTHSADEASELYAGAFSDGKGADRIGEVEELPIEALQGRLDEITEENKGKKPKKEQTGKKSAADRPVADQQPEEIEEGEFEASEPRKAGPLEGQVASDDGTVQDVKFTEEGPWDFSDTYPAPQEKHIQAMEGEGRNPFQGTDTELWTPEEVVFTIEESLSEMIAEMNAAMKGHQAIVDLRSGKVKPRQKKMTVEDAIKEVEKEVTRAKANFEDIAANYDGILSPEGLKAMKRLARQAAAKEQVRKPKKAHAEKEPEKQEDKPKQEAKKGKQQHAEKEERVPYEDTIEDPTLQRLYKAGLVSSGPYWMPETKGETSQSRLFRFPIHYNEKDNKFEVYDERLLERQPVKDWIEKSGITPQVGEGSGWSDKRNALWHHAVDLADDAGVDELIETSDFTTPVNIANAVSYALDYPQMSLPNAKRLLAHIKADRPSDEVLEDVVRRSELSKNQQGWSVMWASKNNTPEGSNLKAWAHIYAMEKGWMKKRGQFLQVTKEGEKVFGTKKDETPPEPTSEKPSTNRPEKGSEAFTTPGTKLEWSNLEEWMNIATELQGRRATHKTYKQLEAHWKLLEPVGLEWVNGATEEQLQTLKRMFDGPKNGDHPWGAPIRGQRRGTLWELLNQRTNDRLAQMKREADKDTIPEGPNAAAVSRKPSSTDNAKRDIDPIVNALSDFFRNPENRFETITQARKFAEEQGFAAKAGTLEAKELEEKIELAIVLVAREINDAMLAEGKTPGEIYDAMVSLYDRQPRLGTRTSKSMADQAYSTPAPLAYLVQNIAGIDAETLVYEPTAGNGALIFTANPDLTIANDIDATRAKHLRLQDFKTTQQDVMKSEQVDVIAKQEPRDVVIGNPPFSTVKDDKSESITFDVDGWKTTQIDHAIVLKSLKAMKKDGKAVFIVGGVNEKAQGRDRFDAYNALAKRRFYHRLFQAYNVVDLFTVSGSLYQKQGAGWPVDIIVIEGAGKSKRALPAVDLPEILTTWEQVKEKLHGRIEPVRKPVRDKTGGADAADAGLEADGRGPREDGGRRKPDTGISPAPVTGEPGGIRPELDQRPGQRPREQQPDQSEPTELGPAERGDRGRPVEPPAAVAKEEKATQETEGQRTYKPRSKMQGLDTLAPTNMQRAMQEALTAIETKHGNIDQWVAKELGYTIDEMREALSAEQVDAVAMGLENIKEGKAFVLGDQTGIGKGRVVASMIRYALRNNLSPIFTTHKPNLYGDIIRDMNDIGIPAMLGREPRVFMTNVGEEVPLDDEAVSWFDEKEQAKLEGEKAPPRRGKFLKSATGVKHKEQMAQISADHGVGPEKTFDVILTTYNQMQTVKGQETERRNLIRRIAADSFLIMDESHNAGGTGGEDRGPKFKPDGTPIADDSAKFFRDVTTQAKSVLFSSATYAKRPEVMDLYARTDMGLAVDDPKKLGSLIEAGGVPMQQVVASMLTEAGQYIRREKSFKGITYDVVPVEVDLEAYRQFSRSMRAVFEFDMELKGSPWWEEAIADALAAQGMAVNDQDNAVGEKGVHSATFSSIMHNMVNQMLLSIKADAVADMAIAQINAGKKPVITVSGTMGAFIQQAAEAGNLKVGQDFNLSFRDVSRRYLKRTMRISVKDADNNKTYIQIEPDNLPEELRVSYDAALEVIDQMEDANLPLSPIDWITHRIQKAGFNVGEITGRKHIMRYSAGGNATYGQRSDAEISTAGRRSTLTRFNEENGSKREVHALILNRAGSTGLSVHAYYKFKNQLPRVMIIAQAEGNIDDHMQLLGRVNRTGQVVLPSYMQAYAEIPAEARPAAVLAKKMASLNANTTASRKSALTSDAVDFINKYGDEVVVDMLTEDPDLAHSIGIEVSEKTNKEGIATKFTGKLTLFPPEEQQEILDTITENYRTLIEKLDALGENTLEAKTMDLEAVTIDTEELRPGTGNSPFEQAVVLEEVEVNAKGQAMPLAEIRDAIVKETGLTPKADVSLTEQLADLEKRAKEGKERETLEKFYKDGIAKNKAAIEKIKDEAKKKDKENELRTDVRRWTDIVSVAMPGRRVVIETPMHGRMVGISLKIERRNMTGASGNPLAMGAWSATIAVPDNAVTIKVPFNSVVLAEDGEPQNQAERDKAAKRKIGLFAPQPDQTMPSVAAAFEKAATVGKEKRYIFTGNILAGFEQSKGGQIINYTDEKGGIHAGILMPKMFKKSAFMDSRPIEFTNPRQVQSFIKADDGLVVQSSDKLVQIRWSYNDGFQFSVNAGRATGGKYFLNPDVRKITGDAFVKKGGVMFYKDFSDRKFMDVVEAMIKAGARFQSTSHQDLALKAVEDNKDGVALFQKNVTASPKKAQAPTFYSTLLRAVEGFKQDKAPKGQWMGMIRNAQGVKAEEIAWLGLEDWLGQQSGLITKEALADFIRANQVQVEEVVKGQPSDEDIELVMGDEAGAGLTREEAIEYLQREEGATKFSSYQLPGGESYRELLLTLPKSEAEEEARLIHSEARRAQADAHVAFRNSSEAFGVLDRRTTDARTAWIEATKATDAAQERLNSARNVNFTSSHFDEPNVLAHVRFNERKGPAGERILFVEEIQSDWHQKGRRSGYAIRPDKLKWEWNDALHAYAVKGLENFALITPVAAGSRMARENPGSANKWVINDPRRDPSQQISDFYDTMEQAVAAYQKTATTGVPDAPFKTTWPELALKRMVRWAAENGFDQVAWTPGEVQNERYQNELRSKLRSITWNRVKPTLQNQSVLVIVATLPNSERITLNADEKGKITHSTISAAVGRTVEDLFGKHIAERILSESRGKMEGEGLEIGGEGMRGFYDKMLVDAANKLGKKFGAKVGQTTIAGNFRDGLDVVAADGSLILQTTYDSEAHDTARANPGSKVVPSVDRVSVHSLPITDAMRDAVMQGQPLFRKNAVDRKEIEPTKKPMSELFATISFDDKQIIAKSLQKIATQILGHRIRLRLSQNLPEGITGLYHSEIREIELAVDASHDFVETLGHEALHALRDLGVFTHGEWELLKREAQKIRIGNKPIMEVMSRVYDADYRKQMDLNERQHQDILAEEAVAYMIGRHVAGNIKVTESRAERIIEKFLKFLQAVRNLMKGYGFQTGEDVITNIIAGKFKDREGKSPGRGYFVNSRPDTPGPALAQRNMPKSRANLPTTFVEPEDSVDAIWNSNLPLLARMAGAAENAILPARRELQDSMQDWARVERAIETQTGNPLNPALRVYQTETLYAGRAGERMEDLRMDELEPLAGDMKNLKITLDELDEYLTARHAPERNAYIATINPNMPDGGSGVFTGDAQASIQKFTNQGKINALQQIAGRIDNLIATSRRNLFNGGIIDQQTFQQWSTFYKYYVPLRGDPNKDEEGILATGRKYDTRTKVDQRSMGRGAGNISESPTAWAIAQVQQSIILSEKARVGRAALRLARRFPNKNLWEVNQVVIKRTISKATGLVVTYMDHQEKMRADNVLAVREGGNLYWVTMHHSGMARGLKNMDGSSMHYILRTFQNLQRGYALMRTGLDPQFFIPNFLRDTQTAGIHISADQGFKILAETMRDIPKAMKGVWLGSRGNTTDPWAQRYRDFGQAGGKVGVFGLQDIDAIRKRIETDIALLQGGPKAAIVKGGRNAFRFMMDINGAVENAVRLSLYAAMRRNGYSRDDAAYAAKEVTVNFNRKGNASKYVNAAYVFFNAGVQGTTRVAIALKRSKLARRAAVGLFLMGLLEDIVNSIISGDSDDDGEDDYDQIPEWIRERHFIFMVPGSENGGYLHPSLPWVYNVFHYAGMNVGRVVRGKIKPTEAAANVLGALIQAANPLQSDSLAQTVTPTLLDPAVELFANKDWKGDPIMPEDMRGETPKPDSEKYWSSVNPTFREAARVMNEMSGGDQIRPGVVDVSPETLEYLGEFIGGGVAATYNQILSTAGKVWRGEDIDPERVPFVRKVYGTLNTTGTRTEYYMMRDAVKLTMDQLENAVSERNQDTIELVKTEYAADIKAAPLFKETDKLLGRLRKARNAAKTDEQRLKVQTEMDKLMARARKTYRKLLEGAE